MRHFTITPFRPIRLQYAEGDQHIVIESLRFDVNGFDRAHFQPMLARTGASIQFCDESEAHARLVLQLQAVLATYGITGDVPPYHVVIDQLAVFEGGENTQDPHAVWYEVSYFPPKHLATPDSDAVFNATFRLQVANAATGTWE